MFNPPRTAANEMERFVNYVLSFYGKSKKKGGLYPFSPLMRRSEAVYAYGILKRASEAGDYSWGDGDSADREHVRDIVLLMRGKRVAEAFGAPETGALPLFSKYAHKRWQRNRLRSV